MKIYKRKVEIRGIREGMRGVFAVEDIAPSEELMSIPLHAIITHEYHTNDPTIKKARRYLKNIDLLAVTVHQEMNNPNSTFKPYFDFLPQNLSNYFLFFDKEKRDLLKGTNVLKVIDSFTERINHRYDNIRKLLPELANFTLINFYRYNTYILSRSLILKINGKKQSSLVPSFDMINTFPYTHPYLQNVWVAYKDRHPGEPYVRIASLRSIKAGTELRIMYRGDCTNTEYLVNYGFVFDTLKDVSLRVELKLGNSQVKRKILRKLGNEVKENAVVILKNASDEKYWQSLRLAAQIIEVDDSDKDMLERILNLIASNQKYDIIFSKDNESKAAAQLIATLNTLLANYPTAIQEDYELLYQHASHSATRGLIQVRPVSYTHLRAHETSLHLVCRLLLEKKKKKK
eukprot:TRINITY_DN8084_c0_g1_i4.p1 TRINITY_DN8084_c0_g1~~TRINITY_DN8084_c0_g1_i4.p1  ORF type:complete len:402 (-),score=66.80 TRINITY_DN8084_c0_g1_i4:1-1206(-)